MLRVVLYSEDTAEASRIAGQMEADPRWELVALCATLADLNFVLDRVTVDVLLLQLSPGTGDDVLSVMWERTRTAHIPLWVQPCAQTRFRAPSSLLSAKRSPASIRGRGKRVFRVLLSPIRQPGPAGRTAKDIMGVEAYSRSEDRERFEDGRRYDELA